VPFVKLYSGTEVMRNWTAEIPKTILIDYLSDFKNYQLEFNSILMKKYITIITLMARKQKDLKKELPIKVDQEFHLKNIAQGEKWTKKIPRKILTCNYYNLVRGVIKTYRLIDQLRLPTAL